MPLPAWPTLSAGNWCVNAKVSSSRRSSPTPSARKLAFLKTAAQAGYTTVLCYIGISGPDVSGQRVAMRVSQGGHDVPTEKLIARFPRILVNLKAAVRELPQVWVFDNGDLRVPFRLVAVFEDGRPLQLHKPIPKWARPIFPKL
jgi:predicted ABC-type ATPase